MIPLDLLVWCIWNTHSVPTANWTSSYYDYGSDRNTTFRSIFGLPLINTNRVPVWCAKSTKSEWFVYNNADWWCVLQRERWSFVLQNSCLVYTLNIKEAKADNNTKIPLKVEKVYFRLVLSEAAFPPLHRWDKELVHMKTAFSVPSYWNWIDRWCGYNASVSRCWYHESVWWSFRMLK